MNEFTEPAETLGDTDYAALVEDSEREVPGLRLFQAVVAVSVCAASALLPWGCAAGVAP